MTLIYHLPNTSPQAKITYQSSVKGKTSRSLPLPPCTDHAIQRKAPSSTLARRKTRDTSTQTPTLPNQHLNVAPTLQTPNTVADDEPTPGELAFLAGMARDAERSRARWKAFNKACIWIFLVLVVATIMRALWRAWSRGERVWSGVT
jgi:hypothetical protein